jgi:hypothetical protein
MFEILDEQPDAPEPDVPKRVPRATDFVEIDISSDDDVEYIPVVPDATE